MTVDERRSRVAELHEQGWSNVRIAAELKCGASTIQRDVDALVGTGVLARHPIGAPAKYPKVGHRKCKREGCGAWFKPTRAQAARGDGDYCSRSCAQQAAWAKVGERLAAFKRREGRLDVDEALERIGYRDADHFRSYAKRLGLGVYFETGNGPPILLMTKDEALEVHAYAAQQKEAAAREAARGMWRDGKASEAMLRSGRARQRWLGRWRGRAAGQLGGRPRGYTAEQEATVLTMRSNNPKLGVRTLASRNGLSVSQVRAILATHR